MTREQQRIAWAAKYVKDANLNAWTYAKFATEGYIAGAEQADSHPVNQWHNAQLELPPVEEGKLYSKEVLIHMNNGIYISAHYAANRNIWLAVTSDEIQVSDVSHWMELLPLPKEEHIMKQLKEGDMFQQAWKGCTNPMWFKVLNVDRPNNRLSVECHGINGYIHKEDWDDLDVTEAALTTGEYKMIEL